MYTTRDMSSTKVFLCSLCTVLILVPHLLLAEDAFRNKDVEAQMGNCSCGGFPTQTLNDASVPLLSQMPGLVVRMDENGKSTCQALCLALAQATKAKGPELLCRKLRNAHELKLSAFYKVGETPWMYVGITADEPLCCENREFKLCPTKESAEMNEEKNEGLL